MSYSRMFSSSIRTFCKSSSFKCANNNKAKEEVMETGEALAFRALAWGTFYACTGFSIFCFVSWKLIGAKDLKDFRYRVGSMLPVIPKKEPQGRTEFESVRDLLNYVLEEGSKKKNKTPTD